MMTMTSNRPYLLRAFHEWIVDNDMTPHLVIDAHYPNVSVPQQYVTDGQITLNIAPRAVGALSIDKDAIAFNTRFGGIPTDVYLPVGAVLGIFAKENGHGMMFEPEPVPPEEPPPTDDASSSAGRPARPGKSGKPSLKIVK